MHDRDTWQQVARLHVENLDRGFLATLGPRFLALMYQAIDACDSSVLLVEKHDNRTVGFVSGAHCMGPIYRQMLKHWPRLLPALLPSLFNPSRLWRILEILRYSGKNSELADLPAFELLSIAVDPSARGQGVSERLYQALGDYCREHGTPAFKIVVGEGLEPAHRFYQRMGARVVGDIEVHRGERSLVYVQEIGYP
jgi:GNAT superfamily N-acetyltransferase